MGHCDRVCIIFGANHPYVEETLHQNSEPRMIEYLSRQPILVVVVRGPSGFTPSDPPPLVLHQKNEQNKINFIVLMI